MAPLFNLFSLGSRAKLAIGNLQASPSCAYGWFHMFDIKRKATFLAIDMYQLFLFFFFFLGGAGCTVFVYLVDEFVGRQTSHP